MTTTKIGDTISNFGSFLGRHGGELLWGMEILKGILGRKGEAAENAPPEVKRAVGMFSQGDEIKITNVLLELKPLERKCIIHFLEYLFGPFDRPQSWLMFLVTFAQSNKWRTFVTDLDSPAQKIGNKKVVSSVKLHDFSNKDKSETEEIISEDGKKSTKTGPKPNTETTTTTKDSYSGGSKNTIKFLRLLIKIIRDEEMKDGKTVEDGYDAAIAYMRALGIPTMPNKETLEWIEKFVPESFEKLSKIGTSVKNHIRTQAQKNREEVAKMSPIQTFFYKLLS